MTYSVRPFSLVDLESIENIESQYEKIYPEASFSWIPAYLSNPSLTYWNSILSVVDINTQKVVGHGHIYPIPAYGDVEDHKLFIHFKIDPNLTNQKELALMIYKHLLRKAKQIAYELPKEHQTNLYVQYFSSETFLLHFFQEKGFKIHRSHDFKTRDLTPPLPEITTPFKIRPWIPLSTDEKSQFIQAKTQAFPETPLSLEQLEFQMQAPYWKLIAAFNEKKELIGSIMLLQPEWENNIVFTEDLFVLPDYQQLGLGKVLMINALHHAKEKGYKEAQASVEVNNKASKTLLHYCGFKTIKREIFLKSPLPDFDDEL